MILRLKMRFYRRVHLSIQQDSFYVLNYGDKTLYDKGSLNINGLNQAYESKDPRFAEYFVKMIQANLDIPNAKDMPYDKSFSKLLDDVSAWRFKKDYMQQVKVNHPEVPSFPMPRLLVRKYIALAHVKRWNTYLAQPKELRPDRIQCLELLDKLVQDQSSFAQASLLDIIKYMPLRWGPWKVLRNLYKQAIAQKNWVIFSALLARFDYEMVSYNENRNRLNRSFTVNQYALKNRDVSKRTLAYLVRLGWRTLREVAAFQPYLYSTVAADILSYYPVMKSKQDLHASWVYNHIVNHNATYSKNHKVYTAESFYYAEYGYNTSATKIATLHAYPELWAQNPKPLLKLLEKAEHESVIQFAVNMISKNHISLVQPNVAQTQDFASFLLKLAHRKLVVIDTWLLNWFEQQCKITQNEYHLHGLHEVMLVLIHSSTTAVSNYAFKYVTANLKELIKYFSIDQVMAFLKNKKLRSLGELLIDPIHGYFKLTLDQCTELLEDQELATLAEKLITSCFSATDFSYDWYRKAINHEIQTVRNLAAKLLKKPEFRPEQGNVIDFYWSLIKGEEPTQTAIEIAFKALEDTLDSANEISAQREIKSDKLKNLHALSDLQIKALFMHPNDQVSSGVEKWVSKSFIKPKLFGLDFLKLICDDQVYYQDKSWKTGLGALDLEWFDTLEVNYNQARLAREWLGNGKYFNIEELGFDWFYRYAIKGQESWTFNVFKETFLREYPFWAFASQSTIANLSTLKGEALKTAKLSAIQEAWKAFVAKLEDKKASWSESYLLPQLFYQRYSIAYERQNPNKSALSIDLAIPRSFFNFERFKKFALQANQNLKDIAYFVSKYDLSLWCQDQQVDFHGLLEIFSSNDEGLKAYFTEALGRTPRSVDERIDLDLAQFEPKALYQFCLSPKASVRDFALNLIKEYPEKYAKPGELSRLLDSSDRRVCEVAVKILWQHFHQIHGAQPWQPFANSISPQSEVAKKQLTLIAKNPPKETQAKDLKNKKYLGLGTVSKSKEVLVDSDVLIDFFKRTAFKIPYTHPVKSELGRQQKVVSAWRNKVTLIKVLRDIALENEGFAQSITPLFIELMQSRGESEKNACLVAIVQLRQAYPSLVLSGLSF